MNFPKTGTIKQYQCTMSPDVKNNLVEANKRAKRYGKDAPMIARFDEYGNILPDYITIDHMSGITLVIADPNKVGKFYLELRTIKDKYDDLLSDYDYSDIMKDLPF